MKFCIKCGTKVQPGWTHCAKCGNVLSAQYVEVPAQPFVGTLENPQVIRFQTENLDRVDRDRLTSHSNTMAITSLWLSIAGLALLVLGGFGVVFSIAGLICGNIAQNRIATGQGEDSAYARTGIILGWVGIGLAVITLLFVLIIFAQ